jgi:hypothetical protein
MIKKEINLSDLVDFFKKNQIPTFDEDIDKFGGYLITATRIAAVIISPDPISKISAFCAGIDAASIRVSKLFSWLPDKFKYKDREKFAIQRYELASYVNFLLLQIAIKNGVKEIVMPHLATVLEKFELSDDDKKELEKKCKESDKEINSLNVPTNYSLSRDDVSVQALKLIDPVFSIISKNIDNSKDINPSLKKIDSSKIKEHFLENITLKYQAFLINFSVDFPEFALWSDITQKSKIIKELKDSTKSIESKNKKRHEQFITQTEQIIKKIEELRDNSFIKESGFPSFINTYEKLFKIQEEHLSKVLSGRTIENINAHQNQIKSELIKPLSDNTDVEQIIYPLNKDIYISQSFEAINYRKKEHRKGFLTADSLGEKAEKGENIGNYLLKNLIDPTFATKPIILLGNPGAGKSMLSKMFAGLLCETNDFIPFLVKLRSVASSSGSISEHINKGLANSIENTSDVNWLEWAKEFRNRTPVVIMDGFDELMQTSNRELNGYVDAIREFQEKALNSNVCVRIILTSRITVMQDVSIPEGTKIIKLDSFDFKRRDLWIRKWNDAQEKPKYKFAIPKNDKIELLAKEPLLMFMLAVYDFENSELQNMANDKTFNQSRLYDSLLNKFIKRQLEKSSAFKDATKKQKEKEEELFRLRLGMIALMMFMNDTTSRDTQKLSEEMTAFGIHKSNIQAENVLGGFFFIHENKSTTEGDVEKFNYEFLHKTFGEFLAADFMLRVSKKQFERILDSNLEIIAKKETFNFCFGYNWLHKHNNIQNFLFEHVRQIFKPDSHECKFIINSIKTDLKELFEKGHQAFPVTDIRLLEKKPVIEHLGIYSQNLVFLWLALENEKSEIKFEIFDANETIGDIANEPKYESQDRDEINKNKLLWKRLSKLWTLVGNYSATAKLVEWIGVTEKGNDILLNRIKSEVIHNFSDSATVGCNDFELLLSYFDSEYKLTEQQQTLLIIEETIIRKPELFPLAIDTVLHRFQDIYAVHGMNLFEWFKGKEISKKQQIIFVKKAGLIKWQSTPKILADIVRFILQEMPVIFRDNTQALTEYLKILIELKSYFPISLIFDPKQLDEILYRSSKDLARHDSENPLAIIEYIRLLSELNKFHSFTRGFKIDFIEESLHRLTNNIRHFTREYSYIAFEYLKLLNELRQYYPIRKLIRTDFFEEFIHVISRDIRSIAKDNPNTVLEYLRLLYDLKEQFPIRKMLPEEFFIELLRYINDEWEYNLESDYINLLEYLKILSSFTKHYSLKELIPTRLVGEAFLRLTHHFTYIIRDNPKEAYTYLKLLRQYRKLYSGNERVKNEIFDEPLTRLLKEIDIEFERHPQIALFYLEFFLIKENHHFVNRERHIIERIMESLINRENESSENLFFIKATAILLIQYNAPSFLIERLLKLHPKFSSLFSNSPEFAKEIIEATIDLTDYERFN